MQPQTSPSPELFWETLISYQKTAAIKSAVELDIFSKIADGRHTADEIAEACGASERGTRILCDAMTILGFLTKNGERYELTESSAFFLTRQSPAFFGSAVDFILSETQRAGFDKLTEAVKKGGTAVEENMGLEPENPMWVTFARGMMGLMMPAASIIPEHLDFDADSELKVLDIAAGHGIFGIKVAQKFPKAEIFALDWANVLEVARENAEKFGVADRFHTIEGSAFDIELGKNYDVVLIPNFLHHFDKQTNETFLRKVHASLKEDGKAVTLEFIPNDDRVSPPPEAMFSLVMLASTPSGEAYPFSEYKEMFENAGFANNQHIPLPDLPQHLIISTKS